MRLASTSWSLAVLFFAFQAALGEEPWKLRSDSGMSPQPVSLAVSPDGRVAAIGFDTFGGFAIHLWDLTTGRQLRRLVGHQHAPYSLCFSPDGNRVLSVAPQHSPGDLRLWSVATGENVFRFTASGISHAVFHPSGLYFAAHVKGAPTRSPPDSAVTYWDAATFKVVAAAKTFDIDGHIARFSPDGEQFALQTTHDIRLLDVQAATWKKTPSRNYMAFSPDNRFFAVSAAREVVLLDRQSLKEVRRLAPPPEYSTRRRDVRGIQFLADGLHLCVVVNDQFLIWEVNQGTVERAFRSYDNLFAFTPDGRLLLTTSYRHLVARDAVSGEYVARFVGTRKDESWWVETSAGYFDCAEGTTLPIRFDAESSRQEYLRKYRQPKLVARLLAGMNAANAVKLSEDHRPPELAMKLSGTTAEKAELVLTAEAHGSQATIERLSVTHNGRALDTNQRPAPASQPRSSEADQSSRRIWQIEVPFPPGENSVTVRATAYDSMGQQSKMATLVVERPVKMAAVGGRLFVLAVGVSTYRKPEYRLRFCHADARELAEALAVQKGRAFGDVQLQVLTDKQATVTNVEDGLAWLARSCTPDDVAVVFFAGHGVRAERGLYYMTHEANVNGIQYTCLNWETVAETVKKTKARQILFLSDTCHAGAFGEANLVPQQELAESLRKTSGVDIFTSSRGDEKSLESEDWHHGAFCKSILEALAGKADADGDGKITLAEIHAYASRRVPELTGGTQHPSVPRYSKSDSHLILAHVVKHP